MVVVNRYSGWLIVQQSRHGSSGLVKCLRENFVTYGIADELSSDGGPEFKAEEKQQLLSNWGVHHRLSSVALAHSNDSPNSGSIPASACSWTTLARTARSTSTNFKEACFNTATPLTATPVYPQHKDFIPILPGSYRPHNTWIERSRAREEAMRARNVRNSERLTEHTVRLQPHKVGDRVFIQNQTGNQPLRWDRTGIVIEEKHFDQYAVKVDGSGRDTLRNRKFLRKFDKIVVDHIPGTTRTVQPLKTLNNAENLSPVNQRTNPEQAQDPPKAKPQTPQPETKRQILTGAQFTQHLQRQTVPYSPQRHRQLQLKPHSSSIAHQMSPSEMRTSLCWTKLSCPTSFLLNHQTRSPDVVINLMKLGHPTSHL